MNWLKSPALIIGSSYREQLFSPFLEARSFGDRPHLYLHSNRVLSTAKREAYFFQALLNFAGVVVISDQQGAEVLAKYSLSTAKTIFWFCWNGVNEVKDWDLSHLKKYPGLKICFLYPDEALNARRTLGVPAFDLNFPVLQKFQSSKYKYLMSYMGEVDIVEGEDDHIWDLVEKFMKGQLQEVPADLTTRQVWILKNRVRYSFVKAAKEKYGKDFTLVGSDWQKYGLDALPSDYDPQKRFELYSSSKLCLDFLSKSTLHAHYPRTAEIVSHSDGLLQIATPGREGFFQAQADLRSFDSLADMEKKIKALLDMEEADFHLLGSKLRDRLMTQTRDYNTAQLAQAIKRDSFNS